MAKKKKGFLATAARLAALGAAGAAVYSRRRELRTLLDALAQRLPTPADEAEAPAERDIVIDLRTDAAERD